MPRLLLLLGVLSVLGQPLSAQAAAWQVLVSGSQGNGPWLPSGVAVDAAGFVYVVDTGNAHIEKLSPGGQVLATWGKLGTGDDGFRRPRGIAIGSDGTLFVADTANHRIQRLSAAGEPLGPWGSIGSAPGEFILPSSVALDSAGNLYVTDTGNHRVQKLAPDGTPLAAWGGVRFPHGIALDAQDTVYVSDESGVHHFGTHGEPIGDWSGSGQFADPYGVTVDSTGSVYVANTDSGRIDVLSSTGELMTSWGSEGGDAGQFKYPEAVAVDQRGNIYVADRGNDRVQVLRP